MKYHYEVYCPYCGEEMRFYPHQGHCWFECEKCGARSPVVHAQNPLIAKSIALKDGKWKYVCKYEYMRREEYYGSMYGRMCDRNKGIY